MLLILMHSKLHACHVFIECIQAYSIHLICPLLILTLTLTLIIVYFDNSTKSNDNVIRGIWDTRKTPYGLKTFFVVEGGGGDFIECIQKIHRQLCNKK